MSQFYLQSREEDKIYDASVYQEYREKRKLVKQKLREISWQEEKNQQEISLLLANNSPSYSNSFARERLHKRSMSFAGQKMGLKVKVNGKLV